MNPFRESIDNKNSFNIGLRKAALRKTGVFFADHFGERVCQI